MICYYSLSLATLLELVVLVNPTCFPSLEMQRPRDAFIAAQNAVARFSDFSSRCESHQVGPALIVNVSTT